MLASTGQTGGVCLSGEWAPTFFALGVGLRLEEEFSREGRATELTSTP